MSLSVIDLDQDTWFKISDFDRMRPFFMSVVSDSNHWMFISSNGGLSAGRKNAQYALFPYYTDDKLTDFADITGSKSIFQVTVGDAVHVWEPFSERFADRFRISRNLYKNRYGNKLRFEEVNHDLGLTFRYEWNSSHRFGFVKTSTLENHAGHTLAISLLDGVQNVMPYGVESDLQNAASNLVDAYKRSELVPETGLGIFALSAIIVDRAEPSEALKANVVWSLGVDRPTHLLSSRQLNAFRNRKPLQQETDVKGERGAYFVQANLSLETGHSTTWKFVANVNLDHAQVIALNEEIAEGRDLERAIQADVEAGTKNLFHLVAGADGIQCTADLKKDARHYANVLFNIMRGGTFDDNYRVEKGDFTAYLAKANKDVASRHASTLEGLPDLFDVRDLAAATSNTDDRDLQRLATEYLPLKFSRRHGDPSRPWNKFSINTFNEVDGSKVLDYQGNWRDIFQNWETLVHAYPSFIEGMICKFLNASTFDGYNPYRVTKDGFDWETIEHDDPWSYIGYWGDHQIIYLLKFLEFYDRQQPGAFDALLGRDFFTYANVPYRIKPYADIARNPKDTIEFDVPLDHALRNKVAEVGADGALLGSAVSKIHHVGFLEKILATVLSKLSNFIPEGGIWMNTQRPEWNDANNALVGNGVSMVTLYYLRRFLTFFETVLEQSAIDEVQVSEEMAAFFGGIAEVFARNTSVLDGKISDADRKRITDALGEAGSAFRTQIYDAGFSGKTTTLSVREVAEFVALANQYLEHSIRANKREDHLYHAYNLMSMSADGLSISYLSEMLEGQVAVISSGYLSTEEVVTLLDALRNSALYRSDQNSYILYPNKNLPGFLQKNTIPQEAVEASALLKALAADGNPWLIRQDVRGGYHFSGLFKNADDVKAALDRLKGTKFAPLVEQEGQQVLDLFEAVFNHKAFTGRSGTFFGYEGLGSIYWHMVSKLHLAAQEVWMRGAANGESAALLDQLAAQYYEIGEGIGIHKTPELYGAFPTDPYSHTPQHRGAQQPGMTGQVKEDILIRFGELGVRVREGILGFDPGLVRKEDFLTENTDVEMVDAHGATHTLTLAPGMLAFTYCQTPVLYRIAVQDGVEVTLSDGSTVSRQTLDLGPDLSTHVFARTGHVLQIVVSLASTRFA